VSGIFSDKNIDLNRKIVANRGEPFGLDDSQVFYEVFRRVKGFGSEPDPRLRIIKKAATLLSAIAWTSIQKWKQGYGLNSYKIFFAKEWVLYSVVYRR